MSKNNYKKGSGLAEILVAVFIFSIILGSLVEVASIYLAGSGESLKSTKGAYLAGEGIEAVKIIRDTGWGNITSFTDNTNYYLYFDTSSSTNNIWKATSTISLVDSIFTRTFKSNSVYRDINGRIVQSGGTLDLHTKKITVSISWKLKNATTTKLLSTYIADIL